LLLQKLEQQLAAAQAAAEASAQQAAAAAELAESRLKEKTAADKEWGRRLSAKEKEAAAKLKEAEARLRELEDKGGRTYKTACQQQLASKLHGMIGLAGHTRQWEIGGQRLADTYTHCSRISRGGALCIGGHV
jgi:hypothetical protein